MKALLMPSYGVLEIHDIPKPEIAADEVLVRIKAAGICGSDIHGLDGSTGRRIPPLVMGHEAAGVIEAVGSGVPGYAPGDRVTFDSTIYCGECAQCRAGRINFCDNRQVLGVACDEYSRQGTFAEYVRVPERVLHRLPPGLSFAEAAMVEPLSIAVHAVSLTPIAVGDVALVIGAGIIGLLTLQVIRLAGCRTVVVADIDDDRLAKARELGATHAVNTRAENLEAAVARITGACGADVSIDAVGLPETVGSAIRALRRGGSATIIGNLVPAAEIPLQVVVSRQIRVQGSNASCGEYPVCIRLIESGDVDVKSLISRVAALDEGAQWFERLAGGSSGLFKVILEP